jgi:hypothetical protein
MDELPYIDTHSTTVAASPEALYETITASLPRLGGGGVARAYARLIGCEDTGVAVRRILDAIRRRAER